ncbi:MAG: GPW/gp25 family protein [Anaerolineaceae bacterium]
MENPLTGDLVTRTNEDAIKEALKTLIMTDRGERLFQPSLGSDVRATLFDLNTPATAKILEEKIRETILNFEPRAELINIEPVTDYDSNQISITIRFYVTNREEPVVVTYFLERTR